MSVLLLLLLFLFLLLTDECRGKSRKLTSNAAMTTSSNAKVGASAETTQKSQKSKEEKGVGSTAQGKADMSREELLHRATPPPVQTYPDIIDIAGMDYSPAKRKPPIHN
ncbi:hypothetical protein Cni_G24275 [Canna indica]|uniref:Uncharacterized protein n=1 Tax=Canna indica TaxID=4628 RepID=A0AAQ3QLB4_9LILI|nr:hypothetical protein Cni_G24275 [Canna indica]